MGTAVPPKHETFDPKAEIMREKDSDTIRLHVPAPQKPAHVTKAADKIEKGTTKKPAAPQKAAETTKAAGKTDQGATKKPAAPQKPADATKASAKIDKGGTTKKRAARKKPADATKAAGKTDKGTTENVDGSGKKRKENHEGAAVDMTAKLKMNYGGAVVDVAAKLKISRRIVNVVLFVCLAVVLGLYVTNSIGSYKNAEKWG